jgi:hypothetical protein
VGKRTYGIGSLQVVGGSWIGVWREPGGRRFKRKVGPARQPGSSEGLTRAQAEREFARVREEQSRLANSRASRCSRRAGSGSPASSSRAASAPTATTVRATCGCTWCRTSRRSLHGSRPRTSRRYILLKRETLSLNTIRKHVTLAHGIFERTSPDSTNDLHRAESGSGPNSRNGCRGGGHSTVARERRPLALAVRVSCRW